MASKTAKIATIGCIVAGCLTFLVGVPFSYLGAIVRYYYGPDSIYATFDPDTCSSILGLPTCGYWVPETGAFLQYLTTQAPSFIGGWCLIGIFAASMSTADGAILAMGTVLSNNILRHFKCHCVTHDNLLKAARFATIPFGVIAALIASTRPNQTGYLLIVAFDVALAAAVVPLFGCFYAKVPRPAAAFASVVTGIIVRIILEFTLPKDSFLLLPYSGDEFLNFGPAASAKVRRLLSSSLYRLACFEALISLLSLVVSSNHAR
jgi:Na+/proline symporter